jgi:enoyl-CoA hydratase/carnithine racemase
MGKWLQSNEHLTFEVRERVARITLNRPDRRNALSWEMLSELRAALLEADDLRSVSVIVLGGAGPDFCAGYDMKSAYYNVVRSGPSACCSAARPCETHRTTRFSGRLNARARYAAEGDAALAPSARHRRHRSRGGSTHRARSSAPRRAHLLS